MTGLEYLLELTGISQKELSEKISVKKQSISMWALGTRKIPKKYLPLLEEIFHVSRDYICKENIDELDKLYIQRDKLCNESPKLTREFVPDGEYKHLGTQHYQDYSDEVKKTLYDLNLQINIKTILKEINEIFNELLRNNDNEKIEYLCGIYGYVNEIYNSGKITLEKFTDILTSVCSGYEINDAFPYGMNKLQDKLIEVFRVDNLGEFGKEKYRLLERLDGLDSEDPDEIKENMPYIKKIACKMTTLTTIDAISEEIGKAFDNSNMKIVYLYVVFHHIISSENVNMKIVESVIKSLQDVYDIEFKIGSLESYNPEFTKELNCLLNKYK